MLKRILKTISIAILIAIISVILALGVVIFVTAFPVFAKIVALLLIFYLAYTMEKDHNKMSAKKGKKKNVKKHTEKPSNPVDNAFRQLGFSKVEDGNIVVAYQKYDDDFDYMHRIELVHKANGNSLILSFQADVNKDGFNNTVGLTTKEAKLCAKKIKQKGWI